MSYPPWPSRQFPVLLVFLWLSSCQVISIIVTYLPACHSSPSSHYYVHIILYSLTHFIGLSVSFISTCTVFSLLSRCYSFHPYIQFVRGKNARTAAWNDVWNLTLKKVYFFLLMTRRNEFLKHSFSFRHSFSLLYFLFPNVQNKEVILSPLPSLVAISCRHSVVVASLSGRYGWR